MLRNMVFLTALGLTVLIVFGVTTLAADARVVLTDNFDTYYPSIWYKSDYQGPDGTLFLPDHALYNGGAVTLASNIRDHSGSQLETWNMYPYGSYSARMKLFMNEGNVMSFFVYDGRPENQHQIDFEFYKEGGQNYVFFVSHNGGRQNSYLYKLPFDPWASYHTYMFKWYPDRVEYYIDNKKLWVSTGDSIPDGPCSVLFNNWVLNSAESSTDKYGLLCVDSVCVDVF